MRMIDADALMDYCNNQKDKTVDANDIARFPTVGGWVSVKDRLPEKPGRYLCWFGKNTFAVGASIVPYIPDLHWFAAFESLKRYENVTHWMPLPEPPKEESDD